MRPTTLSQPRAFWPRPRAWRLPARPTTRRSRAGSISSPSPAARIAIRPAPCSARPDMKRYLGGSDVGFAIPGQGVFVGENLTPDKETGLGEWTSEQIVAAIRTGKTPGGKTAQPGHAVSGLFAPRRRRRGGHRRLSQEPSAGQQQGEELRPEGAGHDQRLGGPAARRLQRPARTAEITPATAITSDASRGRRPC